MSHNCYIIYDNNLTYNGYTNNLTRRLRQHNSNIKGGAKYTTSRSTNWKYLLYIQSEQFTLNTALSFEWHLKYPTNKKPRPAIYSKNEGRIKSLPLVFNNPKFINMKFIIYVHSDYLIQVQELLVNVSNVIKITNLDTL